MFELVKEKKRKEKKRKEKKRKEKKRKEKKRKEKRRETKWNRKKAEDTILAVIVTRGEWLYKNTSAS